MWNAGARLPPFAAVALPRRAPRLKSADRPPSPTTAKESNVVLPASNPLLFSFEPPENVLDCKLSFSSSSLNIFSTWVTLLDPSDVPIIMLLNLPDVDFFPGGVRTRPGLVSRYSAILAGAPQINALKTYITTNLAQRLRVLDSAPHPLQGNLSLYALHAIIAGAAQPNHSSPPPLISAASTWLSPTAPSAKTSLCQYDDLNYDCAQPNRPRRRTVCRRFRHRRRDFARRPPVRGRVRHAPGILDRALCTNFLDRCRELASRHHQYSHGPFERRAAPVLY